MTVTPMPSPDPATLWNALSDDQREILSYAAHATHQEGGEVYLVGGPVRDLIYGTSELSDIDITTTADARLVAARIETHFALSMNARVWQTTTFGTSTVALIRRGYTGFFEVDIATTRTETYPQPGALPVVRFSNSITDDLVRRDFTINAMALPITEGGFGDGLDLFGGMADLHDGLIRVLHDASFVDDPTRLFRALRYATRFSFALEPHTAQLFADAVEGNALFLISSDRKRHEIELAFVEKNGISCLEAFATSGLFRATSPVLTWSEAIAERLRRLLPVIQQHRNNERFGVTPVTNIRFIWPMWAALVCDLDDASLERFFTDMPMPKAARASIHHLSQAYRHREEITADMPPLSTLASWLRGVPFWLVPYFFNDDAVARVAALETRARHIHYQNQTGERLQGDALITLGVPPGKGRRKILDALRHARLDGIVETVQEERDFVQRYIEEHNLKP